MQGRDVDGLLCATPSHHPITSAITMASLASSGRRTDQAPTDNINKKMATATCTTLHPPGPCHVQISILLLLRKKLGQQAFWLTLWLRVLCCMRSTGVNNMRRFSLQFSCLNSAFDDAAEQEIASMLENVADLLKNGRCTGVIRDRNGNTVGHYEFVNNLNDDE